MGWEKRGGKSYFYLARRVEGRVVKTYCGPGVAGRVAAHGDERRRMHRDAQAAAWMRERIDVGEVEALSERLRELCALMTEAVLLTAGFHRPSRHPWRRWHEAWRTLDRV